jgi:very-short-patch-repair endonuclease
MDVRLERRRELRRQSTTAEAALWQDLRGRRLEGFKFRRQHPCGDYILDFFCPERGLAIELDGGQHFELAGRAYDQRRDSYLASRGIRVLRLGTDLVLREREAVLGAILAALRGEREGR